MSSFSFLTLHVSLSSNRSSIIDGQFMQIGSNNAIRLNILNRNTIPSKGHVGIHARSGVNKVEFVSNSLGVVELPFCTGLSPTCTVEEPVNLKALNPTFEDFEVRKIEANLMGQNHQKASTAPALCQVRVKIK
jgi:hypothetical protein